MMRKEEGEQAQVSSTASQRAILEARRTLLNAKWELTDARIAAEVRRRGTLPEGELTEEEIARIAVEMTAEGAGDTRSE